MKFQKYIHIKGFTIQIQGKSGKFRALTTKIQRLLYKGLVSMYSKFPYSTKLCITVVRIFAIMHPCRDDLVYVNLYHYMKFKKNVLWLLWLIGVCLLGLIIM